MEVDVETRLIFRPLLAGSDRCDHDVASGILHNLLMAGLREGIRTMSLHLVVEIRVFVHLDRYDARAGNGSKTLKPTLLMMWSSDVWKQQSLDCQRIWMIGRMSEGNQATRAEV